MWYIDNVGANGSLTIGRSGLDVLTFSNGGNLGLGVTPSAWAGRALQIGTFTGYGTDANGYSFMANNAFNDASSCYKYSVSGLGATLYRQTFGSQEWYNAPSGTAGNAISFTQAMTLTAAGRLLLGTTTESTFLLDVNGTARATQYNVSALNTAPATATSTGTLGEIRVTAGFIYVCTATNTWVRTALTTW
jgi:hypothetical protein